MKKTSLWLTLIFFVILLVGVDLYFTQRHNQNMITRQQIPTTSFNYQIMSNQYKFSNTIANWLSSHQSLAGVYSDPVNDNTYVLITGGIKPTTGYGIALEKTSRNGRQITLTYGIVDPFKGTKVQHQHYIPHMILLFSNSNGLQFNGKLITVHIPNPRVIPKTIVTHQITQKTAKNQKKSSYNKQTKKAVPSISVVSKSPSTSGSSISASTTKKEITKSTVMATVISVPRESGASTVPPLLDGNGSRVASTKAQTKK